MTRMRSLVRLQYLPPFPLPFEVCLEFAGNCSSMEARSRNGQSNVIQRVWIPFLVPVPSCCESAMTDTLKTIKNYSAKSPRSLSQRVDRQDLSSRSKGSQSMKKITWKTAFLSKLFYLTCYWISNPEVIRFVASQGKSTVIISYKKEVVELARHFSLHTSW